MKNNKKGFTLAELLVVVGIIAVLIAIAIPVFTSQLEKSKEAVDAANIRSAYAEVMADALTGSVDTTGKYDVTIKQGTAGWETGSEFAKKDTWPENLSGAETLSVATGSKVTFTYNNGIVTVSAKSGS